MVTGEKTTEYREMSSHWNRRLLNKDGSFKHFDLVKFQHAYKGIEILKNVNVKYSNGFEVHFQDEKWGIKLGKIIEIGNM